MKIIYMGETINYMYNTQGPKSLKFLETENVTRVVKDDHEYFVIHDVN